MSAMIAQMGEGCQNIRNEDVNDRDTEIIKIQMVKDHKDDKEKYLRNGHKTRHLNY